MYLLYWFLKYYIYLIKKQIVFRNKINVKEAMEYVAKAWDLVTAETITNCWWKTRILPTINNDDINDIDDIDDIQQNELAIQENQKIIEDFLQRFSSI